MTFLQFHSSKPVKPLLPKVICIGTTAATSAGARVGAAVGSSVGVGVADVGESVGAATLRHLKLALVNGARPAMVYGAISTT
jgi:hypothetical protein